MWLLLSQSGKAQEPCTDPGGAGSSSSTSSSHRKPWCSGGGAVGVSLRAVRERCLSPTVGRRTSRTLPASCGGTARRAHDDAAGGRHTLPAPPVRDPGLSRPRADEVRARADEPRWLECTYFGAEVRQIRPPPRAARHDAVDAAVNSASSDDHRVGPGTNAVKIQPPACCQTDASNTAATGSSPATDSVCCRLSTDYSPSTESGEREGAVWEEEGSPWLRQVEPPPARYQNDVADTAMNSSSLSNGVSLCSDNVCRGLSANGGPSGKFTRGGTRGREEEGNRWLRQQACRCGRRTAMLSRSHSHDCAATSPSDWTELPASLPPNWTAPGGLWPVRTARMLRHVASGGVNWELQLPTESLRDRTFSGGSLGIDGKDNEHDQEDTATAASDAAAASGSGVDSTSLGLACEILHELEEDLIESSERPSTDIVPHAYIESQQKATTSSESVPHVDSHLLVTTPRQSSTGSDDVTDLHESSSSFRCSIDSKSSPTSRTDLSGLSAYELTGPRKGDEHPAYTTITSTASTSFTSHGDGKVTSQVTTRTTDEEASLDDASAAASPTRVEVSSTTDSQVPRVTSPRTPPNGELDDRAAGAETLIGALRNAFAYVISKLDRKDVCREPGARHSGGSTFPPCGEGGLSRSRALCRKLPAATKNGASLSAAAHLVEVLACRRTAAGDLIGARLAVPVSPPPGAAMDRVLSLVPALGRRRRRCNTAGTVDVLRQLRRTLSHDLHDGDAQSGAVVRRRPRSISIASDWIWSSVVALSTSSVTDSPAGVTSSPSNANSTHWSVVPCSSGILGSPRSVVGGPSRVTDSLVTGSPSSSPDLGSSLSDVAVSTSGIVGRQVAGSPRSDSGGPSTSVSPSASPTSTSSSWSSFYERKMLSDLERVDGPTSETDETGSVDADAGSANPNDPHASDNDDDDTPGLVYIACAELN